MDKNKAISGYEKIFDDGYKAGRASVVLPHPCDGELYKGWTSSDYFAKIAEEHLEVIDAYKAIEKSGKCPTKEEQAHFFKECTDLIVATTGLMHYFGCDEKMRQQYMKEINESNAKRDGGKRFKSEAVDKNFKKKTEGKNDIIEHPAHYTQGIECMDYIESHKLNYARGNIIKYVTRAGLKDASKEVEDLEKARWYLDREIELVKKAKNDG